VADPGISERGAQQKSGGLGAALKPPVRPAPWPGGGSGAKPRKLANSYM
jgi:hypothetical protein